jgi:hypothetical protein
MSSWKSSADPSISENRSILERSEIVPRNKRARETHEPHCRLSMSCWPED